MSFIKHLQSKPKHVRNMYAFGGALSFTLALFFVWGTTLSTRTNVGVSTDTRVVSQENIGMFNFAKNGFASVVESFKQVKETITEEELSDGETTLTEEGVTEKELFNIDEINQNIRAEYMSGEAGTSTEKYSTTTNDERNIYENEDKNPGGSPEDSNVEIKGNSDRKPRTVLISTTTSQKVE